MPIALCLEDLASHPRSSRYTTCVAIRGGDPGLGVDPKGDILWRSALPLACELWVSADEQLILLRPFGAPAVRVERAGRSIDAPCDKPVVLLDQDVFETAGRRFRVHMHGATETVAAPSAFVERRGVGRLAATVAIGVAAISCGKVEGCGKREIEVRTEPPKVAADPPPDAGPVVATDAPPEADASEDAPADAPTDALDDAAKDAGMPDVAKKPPPPIEIRHHPPAPPRRDPKKDPLGL